MPIEIDRSEDDPRVYVLRNDSESALQNTCHLLIATEEIVTRRDLLQGIDVAGIALEREFQIPRRFLPVPLTPFDIASQLEWQRIVRQSALRNGDLGARVIVIEIAAVEMLREG